MKISIITPCFNSSKFIAETIESVVSQKGDFELEYFIIDGGSIDGSIEIIKKYEKDIASRHSSLVTLHYISEPDSGMYDALAKGFKLATGDVLGYLNSDDLFFPGALSVISDLFKNEAITWTTGLKARVNEKGQTFYVNLHSIYSKKMIIQGFHGPFLKYIQQECTFFRKEMLKDVEIDEFRKYKYAGDYYLWRRFSEKEELTVVEALIGGFRFREGQLSENIDEYYKEFNKIRSRRSITGYLQAVIIFGFEYIFSPDIKRMLVSKLKKYFVKSGWK